MIFLASFNRDFALLRLAGDSDSLELDFDDTA